MNDTARASQPAPVSTRTDPRGLAAAASAFFIWGLLPLYLKAAAGRARSAGHGASPGVGLRVRVRVAAHARRDRPRPRGAARPDDALAAVRERDADQHQLDHLCVRHRRATAWSRPASATSSIRSSTCCSACCCCRSGSIAAQWTAVAIAAAGVGWLTWTAGHPPWISLTLAFSFGLYGLVRKVIRVDALAGFASETLLLVPLGIALPDLVRARRRERRHDATAASACTRC